MATQPRTRADWLRICLIALALSYALLAGLSTVYDLDVGWQLATGRFLVEHHQIPRVELFSYTAHGNEWIYPPFSGAIFYLLDLAGGYSALSWLGALACAGTVAFVIVSGESITATLAIVAIPAIAFRTIPRAELFTTLFFAAVLGIVWRQYRGKPVRLWILPVIFFLWANLHLGFISGLGLLGAGVLFDLCDALFASRRAAALSHLKHFLPWIAASFAATFANPWGWRLYEAIYRQNKVMQIHSALIGEWTAVHFNSLALSQALNPRDPASADWWLVGAAALAIVAAVRTKQIGPAIVLAAGMYLAVEHIRLQTLFAILTVVIGGSLLSDVAREFAIVRGKLDSTVAAESGPADAVSSVSPRLAILLATAFVIFVGLRIADVVTDRYYLDSGQITLFGAGPSWWYPERAAAFLEREGLPRNVFHDYGLGGYLAWRIGPKYPDFVDGRYIPFGNDLFNEQRRLAALGPDSPEWQQAADRWQINTAIFSVARYAGLGTFPLQDFCASKLWRPVYLDDVAMIFVRNRAENVGLIERLGIRCESAPIERSVEPSANSLRARAETFNYLMNAASIYFMLSRDADASSALAQAEQIFPDNSNLHLVKAQMLAATNRPDEAEREYLSVVRDHPSDAAWFALARLYSNEHRYPEALRCVNQAASMSSVSYDRLRSAGLLYIYMNQPQAALAAFDRAQRARPYQSESSELDNDFEAKLAEGRARAYRQLNDMDRAVAQQQLATSLAPRNPASWNALADLYAAQGQTSDSLQARLRAQSISDAAKDASKSPEAASKQQQ
jgi:tetratricopeptide (TPR) repeat protein